jgi:hypothetical protein
MSGNPSGLPKARPSHEAMIAEHTAKAIDHHKRPLTPIEVELIEQIVTLKLTKPKTATTTIRIANSINRFMAKLYGDGNSTVVPFLSVRQQIERIDDREKVNP